MLLAYWPNLKAVIGREVVNSIVNGPPTYPVWVVAENALEFSIKSHQGFNLVSTVLPFAYGRRAESMIRATPADEHIDFPAFLTAHQLEDERDPDSMHKSIYSKAFPDATLTGTGLPGFDFFIVETRASPPLELPGTDKSRWSWRLCCLSRAAMEHPGFLVSMECGKWMGVIHWLYLVSTWLRLGLTAADTKRVIRSAFQMHINRS